MFAMASLLAGYSHAGGRVPAEGTAPTQNIVLPDLGAVTSVGLTDTESGARLGAVVRADSVAALAAFYQRVHGGWEGGVAPGAEVVGLHSR